MTVNHNSDIFYSTWATTMKQARDSHPALSISDVESKIWTPAICHCQKLLSKLQGLTMPLVEVDHHFKNYKEDDLESELCLLHDGISKCIPQYSPAGGDWIHNSVCRIADYRKLCNYCEVAKYFLDLRLSLELTQGDFRDVERISQEVY